MQDPRVLKRHATLVDDMAGQMGVDLEEALFRGKITGDEISDAVLRCTGCSNPGHCEGWLAAQTQKVDGPPAYCRNLAELTFLAKDAS